ncbi:MAG: phosphatase PAP2 family protein [bacterium]
MHLPLLHISSRARDSKYDPLHLGIVEGRDWFPWLADRREAILRAEKRTPELDAASLALAAVGSEVAYFALLGGLFSAYDRGTALQLAGVVLPTVAVNQFVKSRFRFPRPPREAMHPWAFVAPGDFTFPSGHSQNAVALGTFLALKAKRFWVRIVGISLATTIPLSRVYLGVHYPRDVLAGAALGLGTVAAVAHLEEPFRDWWLRMPRGPRGFMLLFGTAITGLLSGSSLASFSLGVAGGLAVGHDLSGKTRFHLDQPSRKQRWSQGIVGTALVMGTGFAVRPLIKRETPAAGNLAGVLVGLALTFGVPVATNMTKRVQLWRRRQREQRKRGTKPRR